MTNSRMSNTAPSRTAGMPTTTTTEETALEEEDDGGVDED